MWKALSKCINDIKFLVSSWLTCVKETRYINSFIKKMEGKWDWNQMNIDFEISTMR